MQDMVLVLCSSSNVDWFYMKFREDSSNGFQVIERTRFCDRRTDRQTDAQGKHNMSLPLSGGRHKYKNFIARFS